MLYVARSSIWPAITIALLSGCTYKQRSHLLTHDAYVWQRSWNRALLNSLVEAAPGVQTWRVLAAEANVEASSNAKLSLTRVAIDYRALSRLGKPVIAVVRVNGASDIRRIQAELVVHISALLAEWRASGVPLYGLELDYDCATRRLTDYREFLQLMRAHLQRDLTLSITALPSWMGSRDLPALLAGVNESVLQVHSVMRSKQSVFDSSAALGWAQRWSKLSATPFHLALPTYWSRVSWDESGHVTSIESETERLGADQATSELVVQPEDVASVVGELRRRPPHTLTGFAWFRLPTATDRRAWSFRTWQAVMREEPLHPAHPALQFRADKVGPQDVYLVNTGQVDAKLPTKIVISAANCNAADAISPYNLERQRDKLLFTLESESLLRAGGEEMIGWLRCPTQNLITDVSF